MSSKYIRLSLIFGFVFLLAAYYVSGASTLTVHFPHADSYFNNASMNNTIYANTEGNIVINASVNLDLADANITNVTYWYRALGAATWSFIGSNDTFNLTEYAGNYTYIILWNISNVTGTDGTYQMNVTANNGTTVDDPQQTEIASSIFNIIVDRTNPTTEMDTLDVNTLATKATFYYGDTILIKCTRSDATSGFNDTNMSVIVPQSTDVTAVTEDKSVGTGSTDFTYKYSNTKKLGTYVIKCDTVDRAGNVNHTANKTIEIVTKPPPSSSPFRDPDFKSPVATVLITAGTSVHVDITEEGVSRLMSKTAEAIFTINEKEYAVYAKEIGESSVTFTIADTFDVEVNAEEIKNVDVDADGTDDLSIELHKVFNKKADTTFKLISMKAKETTPPSTSEIEKEAIGEKEAAERGFSWFVLVLWIVVIILVVLIALHFLAGRERKHGKISFNKKDLGAYRHQGSHGRGPY